jgi:hypothetical protein
MMVKGYGYTESIVRQANSDAYGALHEARTTPAPPPRPLDPYRDSFQIQQDLAANIAASHWLAGTR